MSSILETVFRESVALLGPTKNQVPKGEHSDPREPGSNPRPSAREQVASLQMERHRGALTRQPCTKILASTFSLKTHQPALFAKRGPHTARQPQSQKEVYMSAVARHYRQPQTHHIRQTPARASLFCNYTFSFAEALIHYCSQKEELMKKKCAFFDVDGTIIAKDSFRLLILHLLMRQIWRLPLFVCALPIFFISVLLGDRRWPKSVWLWCATVGHSRKSAVTLLKKVLAPHWRRLWFCEATTTLARLRQEGLHIVFVSASGQMWIRNLLAVMDGDKSKTVIGSKIGWFCGGLVLKSKNCFGHEKLARIFERLGDDIEWSEGYSDSWADIPMLAPCKKRYLICPNKKSLQRFKNIFGKQFIVTKWHIDAPKT